MGTPMNKKLYITPVITKYGDVSTITQGLAGTGTDSTAKHENCDVLMDMGGTMDGNDPVAPCNPVS